jgi:pimeloyl-ACP methyl ester carboxylesterase
MILPAIEIDFIRLPYTVEQKTERAPEDKENMTITRISVNRSAVRFILAAGVFAAGAPAYAQTSSFDTPRSGERGLSGTILAAEPPPVPPAAEPFGTPALKEAPVYWDFKAEEVANHSMVVITVCGMDFSTLGHMKEGAASPAQSKMLEWEETKAAVEFLYPGRYNARKLEEFDRKMAADFTAEYAAERAYAKYGEETAQRNSLTTGPRYSCPSGDDQIENWMKETLKGRNALVVPFRWTRNPRKSREALADFARWLPQVYAAAKKAGKPIYIVAHSWGSMLSYTMMKKLMRNSPPIGVDRFITLGSPLVPNQAWLRTLVSAAVLSEGLAFRIDPLNNVGPWINFLAGRDPISGRIAAADRNVRVDELADPYEKELIGAYHGINGEISRQAEKDLALLGNLRIWHHSYRCGAHFWFPSIKKRLDVDVVSMYALPDAFY